MFCVSHNFKYKRTYNKIMFTKQNIKTGYLPYKQFLVNLLPNE